MIDWLVTLNSYVCCIVSILYDTMGLKLMSLAWYAYETWLDGWLYIGIRLVCMIILCLVG